RLFSRALSAPLGSPAKPALPHPQLRLASLASDPPWLAREPTRRRGSLRVVAGPPWLAREPPLRRGSLRVVAGPSPRLCLSPAPLRFARERPIVAVALRVRARRSRAGPRRAQCRRALRRTDARTRATGRHLRADAFRARARPRAG